MWKCFAGLEAPCAANPAAGRAPHHDAIRNKLRHVIRYIVCNTLVFERLWQVVVAPEMSMGNLAQVKRRLVAIVGYNQLAYVIARTLETRYELGIV
jgi:hypothetical protein